MFSLNEQEHIKYDTLDVIEVNEKKLNLSKL